MAYITGFMTNGLVNNTLARRKLRIATIGAAGALLIRPYDHVADASYAADGGCYVILMYLTLCSQLIE